MEKKNTPWTENAYLYFMAVLGLAAALAGIVITALELTKPNMGYVRVHADLEGTHVFGTFIVTDKAGHPVDVVHIHPKNPAPLLRLPEGEYAIQKNAVEDLVCAPDHRQFSIPTILPIQINCTFHDIRVVGEDPGTPLVVHKNVITDVVLRFRATATLLIPDIPPDLLLPAPEYLEEPLDGFGGVTVH